MNEWRCKRCGQTFEEGPCPAAKREREAEHAVIEAAKRYRVELAGGYDGEAASAHKKLLLAVEALLAAEKEE